MVKGEYLNYILKYDFILTRYDYTSPITSTEQAPFLSTVTCKA